MAFVSAPRVIEQVLAPRVSDAPAELKILPPSNLEVPLHTETKSGLGTEMTFAACPSTVEHILAESL